LMRFIDEFRNADLSRRLSDRIKQVSALPASLMEFCGGHTVAIMRNGIRQLLPSSIDMLSGPGCPVCVTANSDVDKAIAAALMPNVTIATFGDMLRVPGSYSSLQKARSEGGDIRVVYSALDALRIARDHPERSVAFIGIGFETTAPTIAACILQAEKEGLRNFHVLCRLKLTPPAMKALLDLGETKVNGIICPGHVSSIIGAAPYETYARDYGVACVVAGFEPVDILQSIEMLVQQIESRTPRVEIAYKRGVRPGGNVRALELMHDVFEISSASWRGMGTIPGSGLNLRDKYERFDAEKVLGIKTAAPVETPGCRCGEVLRGVTRPPQCKLFRTACSPENPVGPCMVSSEGSCSAYYQYGGIDD
jgi:hydrogenase expression/formation protein HypD